MKLTPDDPRLSAWLLGELPSAEAQAVERAVAADPALRLSVEELKRVVRFVERSFSSEPRALSPAQREVVLAASRRADAAGKVVEFESAKRGLRPWLATGAAAAAVVLALTVASRITDPGKVSAVGKGQASEISLLPLPGPQMKAGTHTSVAGGTSSAEMARAEQLEKAPGTFLQNLSRELANDPLPDPARLPAVKPLPPLQSTGEVSLPVIIGRSSYGWVRGWIREKAALPPANAVRVEELVNEFTLPVESAPEAAVVKFATAPCGWNDRALLVAATLRAPDSREALVTWSFEPAVGSRVRVIASPGVGSSRLPDRVPAGRSATVLLEIEPPEDSERLGVLKVDADGAFTGHVLVKPTVAPGEAIRRIELAAAFGLWLRGDGVTSEVLERLAARNPTDETARLVRQALDIAAAGR